MAERLSSTRHQPDAPKGEFTVVKTTSGWTTVNYELSEERMRHAKERGATSRSVELLRINEAEDILTIFPANTLPHKADFLEPRYGSIRSISLEGFDIMEPDSEGAVFDMLEYLPAGFLKDPEYGLGLQKDFRFIIEAVGQIESITKLVITKRGSSGIDDDTYTLNHREFEAIRKGINKIHSRAVAQAAVDKTILSQNALLTTLLPDRYPERHRPYKADTIFKAVTDGTRGAAKLSVADKSAAVGLLSANKRDLAKSHPQELLELRREIELVTLDQLIEKLKKMLAAQHAEDHWQQLFLDNPFILSLAFGLPIVALGGRVSVGGRKFDGTGDKIVDFLHRNALTDNITLMEIKIPKTRLLGGEYRGGVFAPSAELVGSITQALDQRYQLLKNIAVLKEGSRRNDLESYAVKCVIVIGTAPTEPDLKKSLELFRNSLNDVLLITFDELLGKLIHLRDFLSLQ